MSGNIANRRIGNKGIWGAAAVIVAAGVASASLAIAQVAVSRDGSDGGAAAARIVTGCGPNLSSTVITQNSPSTTTVVGWQLLPGAVMGFNVPAGVASRCVKVLLTAETACGQSNAADFCYVRALIDGVPMDPDGANFQAMDSEVQTASAHAYEWVKRVPAGAHTIQIQWRVLNANTSFYADDWTMDIQTAG